MLHIFIINTVAGLVDRSEEIRQFLERKKDFSYLVFDIDESGAEISLMKRLLDLFGDEKLRVYVCGGSGTFMKVISGMEEKDFARVEVAHFPCGLTNDFLKNFSRDQRNRFFNLDNLIRGEVINIDYLKANDGNNGRVLNHVLFSTIGLTELTERCARSIRFMGNMNINMLYVFSFVLTFLFNRTIDYAIEIDGESFEISGDMLFFGNSICLGGSFFPFPDSCAVDGSLEAMILKRIKKVQGISYMKKFQDGRTHELPEDKLLIRKAKEIKIRRKDGRAIRINVDGEGVMVEEWNISIVPGGLKYVVPVGCRPMQRINYQDVEMD